MIFLYDITCMTVPLYIPHRPSSALVYTYSAYLLSANWLTVGSHSNDIHFQNNTKSYCSNQAIIILIFLRRKVPGQTEARTRDLRQHRLALNTNALTL
jgi:hypothetical protein